MAHLSATAFSSIASSQRGSSYSSNAIQAAAIATWPGPMPRKRETSTTMPTSGVVNISPAKSWVTKTPTAATASASA